MEFIGQKKWLEAQRKEKIAEEEHEMRIQHRAERKVMEWRRIEQLCAWNRNLAEFVDIVYMKGTIPSMIDGHDCLLQICEMGAYWKLIG